MKIWSSFDRLIESSAIAIDRPRGSSHPTLGGIVYPLDYGYIEGTIGGDGAGIDIWMGTVPVKAVTGLVLTLDLVKRDSEVKVLYGCTAGEMETIRDFHDFHEQHSLLVVREPG